MNTETAKVIQPHEPFGDNCSLCHGKHYTSCPATMGCPDGVNSDHPGDIPATFRGMSGARYYFGTVLRVAENAPPTQKLRK
jgi:hypothetical protein